MADMRVNAPNPTAITHSAHLCRYGAGRRRSHKCIVVATALSTYPLAVMTRNLPLRERCRRTAGKRLRLEKLTASRAQRAVPEVNRRPARDAAFQVHAKPADATESQFSRARRPAAPRIARTRQTPQTMTPARRPIALTIRGS